MEHIPAGVIYKNRYIDILPSQYNLILFVDAKLCFICLSDPRTRVALYLQSGVANSDYINANFIRVRLHACQHTMLVL